MPLMELPWRPRKDGLRRGREEDGGCGEYEGRWRELFREEVSCEERLKFPLLFVESVITHKNWFKFIINKKNQVCIV